jgi:hypothetical protein
VGHKPIRITNSDRRIETKALACFAKHSRTTALGPGLNNPKLLTKSSRDNYFTVWVSGDEELPSKLLLPSYVAVIVCLPEVRVFVVNFRRILPQNQRRSDFSATFHCCVFLLEFVNSSPASPESLTQKCRIRKMNRPATWQPAYPYK